MITIEKLPQKAVLTFESAAAFGVSRLAAYYRASRHQVCEYSLGIKLMWENTYRYAFTEVAGCLVCRDEYDGITYFDYPIAGEGGDVEAALTAIEEYALEQDIPLRFTTLPPTVLGDMTARYDGVRLRKTYYCADYFYRTDDVRAFEGKRYAGQRNHIRRFYREHPNAVFRPLCENDLQALTRFADRFDASFEKHGEEADAERTAAFSILRMPDRDRYFRIGCMELDGEIIGVAMGEKCGDTLVEHVEKALAKDYAGVYPALFQAFVATFGGDCTFVNREDDAADAGLRTSKMQYQPSHIAQKYDLDVENILYTISEPPRIETERLTLDEITERDAAVYGRLCLDDTHNRYWGYDYRDDLCGEIADGAYFCRVAREDFAARRAMSLAVRRGGDMIGEVVLYHLDGRGSAELGVRILPEYERLGYGREAFAALADWALYTLCIPRLVAKCFRQNDASARLLSSCMRQIAEDGQMLYFEKRI